MADVSVVVGQKDRRDLHRTVAVTRMRALNRDDRGGQHSQVCWDHFASLLSVLTHNALFAFSPVRSSAPTISAT